MWVLRLNDMRSPNIEMRIDVAIAKKRESLVRLLEENSCAPYVESGRWIKSYKSGSILEWFNSPYSLDGAIISIGTEEDWADTARRRYRSITSNILCVD
jgi:hypothetical protein